jgi:hypothetical protein
MKIKKEELIDQLCKSFNSKQWELIETIRGIETPTERAKINLLSKLFKKTIKVSSRKGKARELQKWVAEQISILSGIPWGKDTEIVSREMGQQGTDIRLSERVLRLFPFSVEAKNCENWSVGAFIQQAKKNCLNGTTWLLVLSKNNHEEVVVLDGLIFFKLLKQIKKICLQPMKRNV